MKTGLGKGLDALLPSSEPEAKGVAEIKINSIEPNDWQPRRAFNDAKLAQLAQSIKQHGIVQPIIVRKDGDVYKIVAGERRWRAAKMAGLTTVPAVIKDLTSKETMEVALVENLQREDLNPIEEAEAYSRLIKEYEMTHEEISAAVGKSRTAITNTLRLLGLCESVKELLLAGKISEGHARALLSLEDEKLQESAAKEVIEKNLSVRETERMVKKYLTGEPRTVQKVKKPAELEDVEEMLKRVFKTKVQLWKGRKKGRILIEFYTDEELMRITDLLLSLEGEKM